MEGKDHCLIWSTVVSDASSEYEERKEEPEAD